MMSGFQLSQPSPKKHSPGNSPEVALFLALYLLLLAFFILLNAISTFATVKSQKVMDSLTSSFSDIIPTKVTGSLASLEGEVIASRDFQDEIASLFQTAIPVAKVNILQPGELMQISLRAESLFLDNSTEIPASRGALMDRLVAAMSAGPDTLRYRMEFVIGTNYATEEELPTGENLEMARAGAFARAMMERGVPPMSLQVGFKHGEPGDVRIVFRVMDENATRVHFTDQAEPDVGQ
ncbi:MAG: hypothetical protein A2516_01165 [Alphaproteobacteria bacterium RIFOXYD12_FULL_60_8]|nr:MAG: hypothetical protein A2516_01165 [Alphaproteobacteria bacterium RIFOXYD12_FULL_60_8]